VRAASRLFSTPGPRPPPIACGEFGLTLFYRLAGAGFRLTAVEVAQRDKNVYGAILAAKPGMFYYYIRATDQTGFFHGSDKEPQHALLSLNQCRPLSGRRQEPTRNVRDRLVTLLSVSSPLARQRGCLVHTLGS